MIVIAIAMLAALFALLLCLAFRMLPREQWQILAAVPVAKNGQERWSAVNLTYYGFFVATAEVLAVLVATVLLASTGAPAATAAVVIASVLGMCIPASRVIARIVDHKRYNFSVAGGLALGLVAVPIAAALANWAGCAVSLLRIRPGRRACNSHSGGHNMRTSGIRTARHADFHERLLPIRLILVYELMWFILFLYHGRSMVTSSEISIRVETDRI